MRKDLKTRIRVRILHRLDELGMTARELARAVGHDDAWISGILKGSQGLHWKDFDAVADKLNLPPSELVRYDEAMVRELSPSEQRMVRHFQNWPQSIRDSWLEVMDYFVGSMPDKDTEEMLSRIRKMPRSVRRPVLAWIFRLLEENIPPEALVGVAAHETDAESFETETTHRPAQGGTPHASRKPQRGDRTRKKTGKT